MALTVIDRHDGLRVGEAQAMRVGAWRRPLITRSSPGATGFTMVEMMIALFILTVSVLGLTALTIASIQTNLQNDLRNTAVRITSETAEILLAQPIDSVVSGSLTPYDASNAALGGTNFSQFPNPVQTIRGGTHAYTVAWVATALSNDLTQITIAVSYVYGSHTYSNNAVIHKHRVM